MKILLNNPKLLNCNSLVIPSYFTCERINKFNLTNKYSEEKTPESNENDIKSI